MRCAGKRCAGSRCARLRTLIHALRPTSLPHPSTPSIPLQAKVASGGTTPNADQQRKLDSLPSLRAAVAAAEGASAAAHAAAAAAGVAVAK